MHHQTKGGNRPLRQEDETLAHGAKHMHGHTHPTVPHMHTHTLISAVINGHSAQQNLADLTHTFI